MQVRLALVAVLTIVALHGIAAAADDGRIAHRVQPAGICWDPDVEFPVECDDDDD